MNEYSLTIRVEGADNATAADVLPPPPNEEKEKKKKDDFSSYENMYAKAKTIAATAITTGIAIASKSAGYSGDYITQTRISETVTAAGIAIGVGVAFAKGSILGLAGIGIGLGFSYWDYKQKLYRENLDASYQANYKGARMNVGKV